LHKDIDARKNDQEFCKILHRLKPQTRFFIKKLQESLHNFMQQAIFLECAKFLID
jgi:hypothetical protein